MSKEIMKNESRDLANPGAFTSDQLDIIKNIFCKDLSDDEFKVFLYTCYRTGLDPFAKQIYPVKRWDSKLNRNTMVIQTGIDGYRLIADRTGHYCPGPEPTIQYDEKGNVVSATAYVKKQTKDGTWHVVPATAYYSEYVQTTKDGRPTGMWQKMPRSQTAKCAEALAIRKCWPADFSGIYTKDEMDQADSAIDVTPSEAHKQSEPQKLPEVKKIDDQQVLYLKSLLDQCSDDFKNVVCARLKKMNIFDFSGIPQGTFANVERFCLDEIERVSKLTANPITSMDELVDSQEVYDA